MQHYLFHKDTKEEIKIYKCNIICSSNLRIWLLGLLNLILSLTTIAYQTDYTNTKQEIISHVMKNSYQVTKKTHIKQLKTHMKQILSKLLNF